MISGRNKLLLTTMKVKPYCPLREHEQMLVKCIILNLSFDICVIPQRSKLIRNLDHNNMLPQIMQALILD